MLYWENLTNLDARRLKETQNVHTTALTDLFIHLYDEQNTRGEIPETNRLTFR